MNEYFIHQHRYNTVKIIKSRTVSTGQKGSKSTYNCSKRYVNEETHCTKTKHYYLLNIIIDIIIIIISHSAVSGALCVKTNIYLS